KNKHKETPYFHGAPICRHPCHTAGRSGALVDTTYSIGDNCSYLAQRSPHDLRKQLETRPSLVISSSGNHPRRKQCRARRSSQSDRGYKTCTGKPACLRPKGQLLALRKVRSHHARSPAVRQTL